jgi:isopentenyldiphosphate isomerase
VTPTNVQQNDPTELLEVFDASGRPTGRARPRAAIHLAGDWHQAFHCWILRRGGQEVVLQRRSSLKDTYPGYWDAAAAGHWRFGESAAEAAREITEELGLDISFADLAYRGRERASQHFANGLIDREFHQVYVLELDQPLSCYRPDRNEVMAVAAFPSRELVQVAASQQARVAAIEAVRVAVDGRLSSAQVVISRSDMVPYSAARLRRMLGKGQGS